MKTEKPKIDLVEFSDFACPVCKTIEPSIARFLNTYPDTLRMVLKDAPNSNLHTQSMLAHLTARCAQKQNTFRQYHDELFKITPNFTPDTLKNIAQNIGLDQPKWQTCFDDQSERAKIERGLVEAKALGVDATPFIFLNNQKISGATTFDLLQQMIINELNTATTTEK